MKRDLAVDYLRSGITVAVVAHHAALAYCTFSRYDPVRYTTSTAPVVDRVRFAPLDYLVAWNDIFFMTLMFFISGLFVAPALARKGPARFLADRARRLGIPFAAAVTLLMPLAYYPSWSLSREAARGGFLLHFFTTDGWPAGPPWFLWLLLAFCTVTAVGAGWVPRLHWTARSPWSLALVFLMATLAAVVPVRLLTGPYSWWSLGGPFDFQTSRLLLYFTWFLLGVGAGRLAAEDLRPWRLWLMLGLAGFAAHWLLSAGGGTVAVACAFAFCCTFTSLGGCGAFRAWVRSPHRWADSLSANAYGIYIVHYVFVTWMQFLLLTRPLPASVKFALTFAVGLGGSWLSTAAFRALVSAGKRRGCW